MSKKLNWKSGVFACGILVLALALVMRLSYGGGSATVPNPGSATLQYADSNVSDMLNGVTISSATPYHEYRGSKVFSLGHAHGQDSGIVSPCNSESAANYTEGIYNCRATGVQNEGQVQAGTRNVNQVQSLNWGGYAGTTNVPASSSVDGSWTVQTAGRTTSATYSAPWIGIGGYSDSTLIQTGTESDYYSGAAHYTAWYEVLPAYETPISGLNISPGDVINSSVTAVANTTNQWNITLIDTTKGQGFSIIVSYNSSKLSTEWIEERPEICSRTCSLTTLASFGTSYFGDDYTSIGSTNFANMGQGLENLSSLPSLTAITMVNQNGRGGVTVLSQPSPVTADGTSFSMSGPAPPTTTTTTVRTTSTTSSTVRTTTVKTTATTTIKQHH